jgi:O-antigen ligase
VNERSLKAVMIAGAVFCPAALLFLAYSRPGYFTSQIYIGSLLLLEALAAAVWLYRQVFFPIVMVAFLFAGVDLPVGAFWTQARWFFLAVGAVVGSVIMLKERSHHYGLFHVMATFAVLATVISATVSQFPGVALLKALSFGLLFLYAGTGARLSVTGRESRFFTGLLTGFEVLVVALAFFYAVGTEAMGNPNALGAVMGVGAAPVLFWGALLDEPRWVKRRRWVLYGVAMYLTFHSHSRAGMGAALISSGLLCLVLRRYRMIGQGVAIVTILVAAGAIFQPERMSNAASSLTTSVVFKGHAESSLLASRETPWKAALDSIDNHFWFGTGLGTVENPDSSTAVSGMFSSSSDVTAENGSSYLAILAGVGMIGSLPFLLLLLLLLGRVFRTISWILRTGNPCHPAVPIAMIIVAGLIHGGFEDWLFAPGYYLCIFFWSLAFVFVDVAPQSVPSVALAWRFRAAQQRIGGVVPGR